MLKPGNSWNGTHDGQITSTAVLLDRYRQAPPATKALIDTALDARRLGCGPHLPLAL